MTCLECQTYLQQRLDERRSALATLRVADHLAACSHCRALYDLSESSLTSGAPSPFYGAPDGFAERVLNRVGAERKRRNLAWFSLALSLAFGLPLALAVFALLLASPAQDGPKTAEKKPASRFELAQLMQKAERLKSMPKESFEFTARLAVQARDSAVRLAPRFDRLPPSSDAFGAMKPIREVGAQIAGVFVAPPPAEATAPIPE